MTREETVPRLEWCTCSEFSPRELRGFSGIDENTRPSASRTEGARKKGYVCTMRSAKFCPEEIPGGGSARNWKRPRGPRYRRNRRSWERDEGFLMPEAGRGRRAHRPRTACLVERRSTIPFRMYLWRRCGDSRYVPANGEVEIDAPDRRGSELCPEGRSPARPM